MTREQRIALVRKLSMVNVGADVPEDKKSNMPGIMSILGVIGGFFVIRGIGRWVDRG